MITVVRHGRTAANAEGLLLGRLDPELDAEGHRQASAAARWLSADIAEGAAPPVARIVTSPLARTRATAAAIASELGLDDGAVETDDRWLELDYGELDGVPLASVPAETWARWRADADFCPAGGECLSQLGARVRAACDDLRADAVRAAAADGGSVPHVVVVSHVSPIKAAMAWGLCVDDELLAWRLYVSAGSVSRIGVHPDGRTSVRLFNLVP